MASENKPKTQLQIQKEMYYDKVINSLNLTEKKINIFIGILIAIIVILVIIYSK